MNPFLKENKHCLNYTYQVSTPVIFFLLFLSLVMVWVTLSVLFMTPQPSFSTAFLFLSPSAPPPIWPLPPD